MQIINNDDESKTTAVKIQSVESINNITAYLVNNDFDLAENSTLVEVQDTGVTVTVPARSLVVLAVDGSWADGVSTKR